MHAFLSLDISSPMTWTVASSLFFAFCIGHALADFPLQGDFLAHGKSRHAKPVALATGNAPPKLLWVFCLTAHALIHAGFVWCLSGRVLLGLAEFVAHWIIDFVKCEGRTSFETDQFLHLFAKVVWIAMIWGQWV